MKSQIWRLAAVSVLSLAMFGSALADDGPDARAVFGGGGGGSQRDQGRGNSGGGNQGGGNQGGGQSRPPQQQQGPQGASRTLGGSSPQRDDHRPDGGQGGYGGGYNNGGYNQGGHNQGGSNQGGYNQGGYNQGYNGGHNGGRDDDDHRGRPSNNQPQGPQGPSKQLGGKAPPPREQWHGGRPDGGWGPGPRWQPGYRVDNIPQGRWRVPHGGIDYYYSDGYWYRPYGPSYIVVTPPYGVRVRTLPSYAEQLWIGSALYFIAAGTYYLYQADRQEYVVTSPPTQVTSNNGWQGNGYDVVAYPARGQSEAQVAQDRYDCHRWAVNQSGFDPSQANYAPAANVADIYRRSLGACMAGRGYSVN